MEEVESSSNINNLLSRLRALAVRKLVGISIISTYNSHADCTKKDDFLQISRMATWRSFWVVGRNCETPVQGDLAEESVLISELRLWSTLKYKICKNAKKNQMCKKIGIASSSLLSTSHTETCSGILSQNFRHRLRLWFHHWPSCIKWTCKSVSNESVLLYLVISAFELPYTPGRPAADGPWWASASDQPEQR